MKLVLQLKISDVSPADKENTNKIENPTLFKPDINFEEEIKQLQKDYNSKLSEKKKLEEENKKN